MATENNPTLLIVHGGWYVPDSYEKLTNALRGAGFEVHIPRLLSMNNARPPNADLISDSDLIRSYATSLVEAGRTVVVVLHSYGGQGLTGGISHLIYLTGFALVQGKSMVDVVAEFGHMDDMPIAFGFDEDRSCVPNFPKEGLVGQPFADQLDPKELKTYLASLCRWNGEYMHQPLQNTPAWSDDVKVSYIYTRTDLTNPLYQQKSFVEFMEKGGKQIETVKVDSGHSPNLTATKEVDAIIKFTSM
ncbi:Alpha/beta hydrolase fold-1 [Hypoxylon trugodes]|uniref:Alpha/beta hydrolase fold-1 n=1 Tax=Hypoxylon trugodes TaxID=326681 RepID=UPI00219DD619|nr:Alpha/beta hydrolase fold-1 [Hypoxylon trugodes]KAI1383834.1 Alpha/beta hydrolase fold-1 [Hypoxylon trugodes]